MELIESKSLLAKLMATENLIVEQRPVQTASFNVKDRVLTLPILDKNISSSLYDLFTGHEVGHALYTPMEGMVRIRQEKINFDVCNVVEDSRIERKIKYKYPGLKSSFSKAYKELIEKDFFGIKDSNVDKLNFLDRINLHCKVGAHLQIKFNDEELALLKEVESTETYDDVIEVSKKIIDFMKSQILEQRALKVKSKSDVDDSSEDGEKPEEVEFEMDGETVDDIIDDSPPNDDEPESEEENENNQKSPEVGEGSTDEHEQSLED